MQYWQGFCTLYLYNWFNLKFHKHKQRFLPQGNVIGAKEQCSPLRWEGLGASLAFSMTKCAVGPIHWHIWTQSDCLTNTPSLKVCRYEEFCVYYSKMFSSRMWPILGIKIYNDGLVQNLEFYVEQQGGRQPTSLKYVNSMVSNRDHHGALIG